MIVTLLSPTFMVLQCFGAYPSSPWVKGGELGGGVGGRGVTALTGHMRQTTMQTHTFLHSLEAKPVFRLRLRAECPEENQLYTLEKFCLSVRETGKPCSF